MSIQLSPYKITMYKKCPKQYSFYCDPEMRKYRKDWPYFTMGEHVHKALKDIFTEVSPEDRNIDKLIFLLKRSWVTNRKGFKDEKQEADYGNRAIRQLQQFVIKDTLRIDPIMIEKTHEIRLDNNNLTFLGKIDRVDENPDGSLHIIDYKTGKSTDEEPDFDQLYFYALILSKELDKEIKDVSYLYLEGYDWVSVGIEPNKIAEIEEKLVGLAHSIIDDKKFEPTPNQYCRTCDYLEICPKKDDALSFLAGGNDSPLPF